MMSAGAPVAPRWTSGSFHITHTLCAHGHASSCGGRALRQQKGKKLTARARRRPVGVLLDTAFFHNASQLRVLNSNACAEHCPVTALQDGKSVATLHMRALHSCWSSLQRPVMKQNASSSDSFGSIDEEVLKELKNVPMVLATQDEMDMRDVVRGLRHRLKVL